MEKQKNQQGITLIALVVTIIVLLILAGVSLSLIAGSNGIISKAERAIFEHKKAEGKEIIEMAYAALYIDSKIDGTGINKDNLKDELTKAGKDFSVEDKQGDDNKLIAIDKETGNAYEVDKENGKTEYIGSYTGKYEDIEIKEGDIIFETNSTGEWSKEDVTVKIKVSEDIDMTNFEIQVSKDGKNWELYPGEITLTETTTIYVKVVDKVTGQTKATASTEVKIDKDEPTGNLVVTEKTTATAKVKVTASDMTEAGEKSCSDIKGYYYSKDNGASYTEMITETEYSFTGLTQGTEYKFKVKIEDNAGNIKEVGITESTNLVNGNISFGTPTWSGTNASMTITGAQAGCTLQYKIGSNGTWTNIASGGTVTGVPSGTVVFAKLVEGDNVGKEWASDAPLWTGTVSYNANGGSGGPSVQSVQHTKTVTVSFSPVPTKANSVFLGWSTSSTGNAMYTSSGTKTFTMGTGNVTLYAIWHTHTGSASSGGGCYGTRVMCTNKRTTAVKCQLETKATYVCSNCGQVSSSSGTHYLKCTGTETITVSNFRESQAQPGWIFWDETVRCDKCGYSNTASSTWHTSISDVQSQYPKTGICGRSVGSCGTYTLKEYKCSGGHTQSSSGNCNTITTYCCPTHSSSNGSNGSTCGTFERYERNCGY